eukprot:TRINITY_DN37575_c0_g1_i1.p2 TRINITY_DN37575_c0_g1~~TRINITY_DN37575_c0_g1_i1.p2  ORF type:complete len:168 (+),score=33.71 TRINITY_DN37575_c0_g1_i1:746-1249(+)
MAVAAGRRSIKLNGFEGQVHMLQRRVTSSTKGLRWHCRDPYDLQDDDNIVTNAYVAENRRCWYQQASQVEGEIEADPLAASVDAEVARLGYGHVDILKISFSSVDILRGSEKTLAITTRVLAATDPLDTQVQAEMLVEAGFEEVLVPTPEELPAPYSAYVIGRRTAK